MTDVYVVGTGMTQFGRHRDRSLKSLVREAVDDALTDAGVERKQVQEAYFGNCVQGYMEGQHMIRGHVVLLEQGFDGIPVFNLESGCASSSMGFNLARKSLLAGDADLVLAVGAEKMYSDDKEKMFNAFTSAWDVSRSDWQLSVMQDMWSGYDIPEGTTSGKPYSPFMDVYKGEFVNHVKEFGVTQEQVAAICAKNHQHSVNNPKAQFRMPYTVEEVLAAPPITWPLTLPMCAPVSDGASATILCTGEALDRFGLDRSRAIRVLGSVTGSGMERSLDDFDNHIVTRLSRRLYQQAGAGPEDVDVVELHDATAVGELIEVECLGLCPMGEGGLFAGKGETTLGGKVPVNTSGGLESRGHPIAATGLAQIYDLVKQLRGEAGKNQVEGARLALQCNVGGWWNVEEASAHLCLLSR